MPVLVAWILNGLRILFATRLGVWIAGALAWAGLSLFTTKVVLQPTIDALVEMAQNIGNGGDMGAAAVQWAGVLHLDTAITMVISAYVTKHAISGAKVFLGKRP